MQPAKSARRVWWRPLELLIPLLVLLAWFLLNRYILPAAGVPT